MPLAEGTHTTHFSIVDAAGNAVAVTTTLNGGFGSGVVVRGAGFVLNNEMDDFTSQVGTPNMYGLVQGERGGLPDAVVESIYITPDGTRVGAADPRRDSKAMGY